MLVGKKNKKKVQKSVVPYIIRSLEQIVREGKKYAVTNWEKQATQDIHLEWN